MSDRTEPRLWPADASPEYVDARQRLRERERELRDQLEEVAAQRRALPAGTPLGEYAFDEGPRDLRGDEPVTRTTLRDAFGDKEALVVYHLMFEPGAAAACPMCSMWVDGFHGVSHHLGQHVAVAVVAKATLPELRAWGRQRGWDGLRLLSSHDSDFNAHVNFENPDGSQNPGVSVFARDGDVVRHTYSAQASLSSEEPERGIDPLSPVWQVLDLLPEGRPNWYAGNDYAGRERGDTAPAEVSRS
jgi:predicted dithiol-disulfide oxidoreductase (DUF899 family)